MPANDEDYREARREFEQRAWTALDQLNKRIGELELKVAVLATKLLMMTGGAVGLIELAKHYIK